MSRTIDEQVVAMRFDNENFEANVKTSLGTIDKLKQSLKFDKVQNGVKNISSAVKKVDFSPMNNGIQQVQAHFSALEVVGMTALSNITNSAVNAGKRMISALTVEPLINGWQEYETQINAVQTIMANTKSKGTTMTDITAALDELNAYADKTIYNFGEMTKNIGTFTAAGVGLEESVGAIKGIANLGAMSGSSAAQVSTAMYQLSQALAAGRVSLMDWNSVVNAGMGGEQFQNALKRTAEHFGYNVDGMIEKYGSFRESLTRGGWLTAEVLTETLNQISGAYTKEDLIAQGYTESQAEQIVQLAQTAEDAATKVKTFTQLVSTLQEALGSGWAKTWQLIFGDFEEAQGFFTEISQYLGDIIGASADARNALIETSMDSSFQTFSKNLTASGKTVDEFQVKLSKIAKGKDVDLDDLIGQYGSLEEAIKQGGISVDMVAQALEDMGYEASDANQAATELMDNINKPSGRQLFLRSIINLLKAIVGPLNAVKTGFSQAFAIEPGTLYNTVASFEKFTSAIMASDETLDKITRTVRGVFSVFRLFTTFFSGTFGIAFNLVTAILDNFNLHLLDITAFIGDLLYAFTNWIRSGEVISSIMQGLGFILQALSAPFKGLIDWIMQLPVVEEAAKAFDNARRSIENFFNPLISKLRELTSMDPADAVAEVANSAKAAFSSLASNIQNALANFTWEDFIAKLTEFGNNVRENFARIVDNVRTFGPDIIQGLKDGLSDGISGLIEQIRSIASKIIEAAKAVLGIHSPSTVFFDIGKNIIEGLTNGIKFLVGQVGDVIKSVVDTLVDAFSGLDMSLVIGGLLGAGSLTVLYKFTNALENFSEPFANVGDLIDQFSETMQDLGKALKGALKGAKFSLYTNGLLNMAKAIAILAASLLIISFIDTSKLLQSVAVLGVLMVSMAALAAAMNKVSGEASLLDGAKMAAMLLSLGTSFALLAGSFAILGMMDSNAVSQGLIAITAFGGVIAGLVAVTSKYKEGDLESASKLAMKFSQAILILSISSKILATMSWEDMGKAGAGIASFGGVVAALIAITKYGGKDVQKTGYMISKIGKAFLLLAISAKLIGSMSWEDMAKAGAGVAAFGAVISALIIVNKFVGGSVIDSLGNNLLKMSISIGILVVVAKMIAGMSPQDLAKGIAFISAFGAIVSALALVNKILGAGEVASISANLLAMSAAIGILAGVAILLGMIDIKGLAKGIVSVSALSALVSLMSVATRGANDIKGTMIGMAVAIGALAASVAVLSFIDTGALAKATAAISVLMGMLAVVVKASGSASKSFASLIVLTAAITAIGGILIALSVLNPENVTGVAASISALMLSMAATMKIIDGVGSISKSAIVSMAVMTVVVAGIAGVLAILSTLNVSTSMSQVAQISVLLLALSAACRILSTIKSVSASAIAAMAALDIVLAGLVGVMALVGALNVDTSIENVSGLVLMLTAMTGITAVLGIIGQTGPAAIKGAAIMGGVIGVIAAVVAAAGAIKQIPGAQWLVDEGGEFMQSIGTAIGKLVGGLAGGALEGLTDSLPAVADSLSGFMTRLTPFLQGVNMIDENSMNAVSSLAGMILSLTASNLLDAITTFLGGETDFVGFAEKLIPFGQAMVRYSDSIKGLDSAAVRASAQAGQGLADLANSLPKEGGLVQAIFGDSPDLGSFGLQMVKFGTALKAYGDSISGIDIASITSSAQAGQALSDLANSLPKSGGLAQAIFGDSDLGEFGTQIIIFGMAIKAYSQSVSGLDVASIERSAKAGWALADLADALPNSGGVISLFTGDNDFGTFGDHLKKFGDALAEYSKSVNGVDTGQIESTTKSISNVVDLVTSIGDASFANVESITTGLENLGKGLKSITGDGGAFSGINITFIAAGIKQIGDSISAVSTVDFSGAGNGMQTFVTSLQGLPIQLMIISASFQSFTTTMITTGVIGMTLVSAGLNSASNRIMAAMTVLAVGITVGGSLVQKSFSSLVASLIDSGVVGFNLVAISVSNAASTIKSAMSLLADAISGGSSAARIAFNLLVVSLTAQAPMLGIIGFTAVMSFVQKSQSALRTAANTFRKSGKNVIDNFRRGISEGESSVVSTCRSVARSAANEMSTTSNVFYNAGKNAVQGFARGMRNNMSISNDAARKVASNAYSAAQKELDSHSPSRRFMKLGLYSDQGLAKGMDSGIRIVEKSASKVANRALTAVQTGLSTVKSILENDDGFEINPVIRPVIDSDSILRDKKIISASLSRTRNIAQSIASIENDKESRRNEQNQNGSKTGTTVTFTQNNYSPKALSRIDIYRDTKNQLSQMKGALT